MLLCSLTAHSITCIPVRVVDGDTFKCEIYDLPEIFGSNISVRLKDCDSPEINSTRGEEAKKELADILSESEEVTLENVTRGKYFRLVADVYVNNQKVECPNNLFSYAQASYQCGSKTKCSQMVSCEEAYYYLNTCGLQKLDRDNDGIPCESLCN